MPILQVALSNTFNEFRTTFNDAANTVNALSDAISANTITLATLTSGRVPLVGTSGLITDDPNLTYDSTTDILTLGGPNDASSTTTGTLRVSGGVGIVKNVYVGGIIDTANTTESTSVSSGALIVDGGAGVAKNLYVGGIIDTANTTQSSNVATGALIVDGGAGIAKNLYVGGNTAITDTTQSTSTTTGSLQTLGGAGIAKNLYVGGIIDVADTTQSSNVATGALIVDGGAGIAKNVYVGGDMQVAGNLLILGANSTISTTVLNIEDNILQLSHLNSSDLVDIGFIGGYNNGANVHSGFFRDASDDTWKLFKNYNVEPTTTINVSANGFAYANLIVDSLQANNKVTTTGGVDKLTTATGAVSVAGSAAPTAGAVLTATDSANATWQTPTPGLTTGKAIALAIVMGF
jgi:hypothetical protein